MKWLEIIKLRTSVQNIENMVNEFMRPLTKDNLENGLLAIQVYCHATLVTDLSIHIQWETKKASSQKSLVGSCIVNVLEDFGITHHTIWIRQEKGFIPHTIRSLKNE